MRFYLDADLSWRIARIARNFGIDVISAIEVDMRTATDEEQLAYASEQGRCIVTNNRDDFMELDRIWQIEQSEHAGILITADSLPSDDFAGVARALAYYDSMYPEPFIPGLVDYLHPAPPDP
jgi:predicted nuclease of predicted toxin-antitoxin system